MRIKRRGFTVLELIIVLATMAILAAGVFAAFEQRRRPGRQRAECQQNLRQISLAIKQYCSDHDNSFPFSHGKGKCHGWADSIMPYLKDKQLFQCPTEKTWPARGDGPKSRNYTDYFYNANLNGHNEDTLQYMAMTIVLGDAVSGDARQHSDGTPDATGDTAKLTNRPGVPVGAATRHLDGANYVFADGHIKWYKGLDANTCPAFRIGGGLFCGACPGFSLQ